MVCRMHQLAIKYNVLTPFFMNTMDFVYGYLCKSDLAGNTMRREQKKSFI